MPKRTGVWLFTIAVLATCSSVLAAGPADEAANVTGHWSGYFDGFSIPATSGAVSIEISDQDGRRFTGEICFSAAPCTPVAGTVAESGEITMTGRTSDEQHIEVHGSPFDQDTRPVSTIVADYHVSGGDGAVDRGVLVLVHQGPPDRPPAGIAGTWGGQWTPEGTAAARPVELTLEVGDAGAITGRVGWDTDETESEVVGQAIGTSDGANITIVGRLNDGLLVARLATSASVVERSRFLEGDYGLFGAERATTAELGHVKLLYAFFVAARQREVREDLKALYTAEKAYFQEKDTFLTRASVIGFDPERNNRYRYVLTTDPVSLEDRSGTVPVVSALDEGIDADLFRFPLLIYPKITSGPCVGTPVWGVTSDMTHGIRGHFVQVFTGAAYGDIDGDNTLDLWTISTVARVLSGPQCDAVGNIPAGEPANERNDIFK